MQWNEYDLLPSEAAVFALRRLYLSYGYRRYKISKFEEYDLYAQNRSFLADQRILTFTDTDGRLMALKPDITLSIIKNTEDGAEAEKVFYNECVYRTGDSGFTELMQTGLECIGRIDDALTAQVIELAYRSLACIGKDFLLDISHVGFLSGLVRLITDDELLQTQLLRAAARKSRDTIRKLTERHALDQDLTARLADVCTLYGTPDEILPRAKALAYGPETEQSLAALQAVAAAMKERGLADNLRVDFSVVSDTDYYSGVVFRGFLNGISKTVLSGGRYDHLLRRLGKQSGAIGFAVYLDELDRLYHSQGGELR